MELPYWEFLNEKGVDFTERNKFFAVYSPIS